MLGLMQDWPLLLHRLIDHAATQFGAREIVSRSVEGALHRTDYATARGRALRVAQRLAREGVRRGDRVATLAWNTWRHFEVWYGIAGLGAVVHTVNPRLSPEQIAAMIDHAQDRALFCDLTFVPLLEKLAARLPSVERYIVLTDAAHMPETALRGAVAYEDWLADADGDFRWTRLDEREAAGLCYTSGSTGEPKGVLYSHRSNVLHAMSLVGEDAFGLAAASVVLPVVPLYHANAWSLAFSCPMVGAKLVLPGPQLDGASLRALMEQEGVTVAAGVPTIWMGILDHARATGARFTTLRRALIGGSACAPAMIESFECDYGLDVRHAWGMTEMSPVGSFGALKPAHAALDEAERRAVKARQGFAGFGVEMAIEDVVGARLPWDGVSIGRLKVAGPAVAERYYGAAETALDANGYFDTGDIAVIGSDGVMRIVDRAKDVIKSGGEWIASIALEICALEDPAVAEAAVIAAPHPHWGERPLLIVTAKAGRIIDPDALLAMIAARVERWRAPDSVIIAREMPHNAAGKIDKQRLRTRFLAAERDAPGLTTESAC